MLVYIPAGVIKHQEDGRLLVETELLSVVTKLGTYRFETGVSGELTVTMRHMPTEAKQPLPSPSLIINDPEMVAKELIADLGNGNHNGYDRTSRYYVLAQDTKFSNSLSVSIIEERDGLAPEEYYYSVKVIDGLTNEDAELLSTDHQTLESLAGVLRSIQKKSVEKYKSKYRQ